jgi:type VI secretion system protein VasI
VQMKLKNIALLQGLLGLCLANVSYAATDDLQQCMFIKADAERLVCYDKVSGRSDANKKTSKDGRWEVSVEKDPLNDSLTTLVSTASVKGKNRRGQKLKLGIRCMNKEQEFFVGWGVYIERESSLITTRVRDEEAFDAHWAVSTHKQSTSYPHASDLIQKVRAGGSLVVQVVPYNENPITATFNMGGLDKVLKGVKNECGW